MFTIIIDESGPITNSSGFYNQIKGESLWNHQSILQRTLRDEKAN